MRLPKLLLLVYIHICVTESAKRRLLHESLFLASPDGWSVEGAKAGQRFRTVSEPRVEDRSLEVNDVGSDIWYFVSDVKYSGDKTIAYNGQLTFKVGHSRRPDASRSQRNIRAPDVILEAECGHSLQQFDLIDGSRGIAKAYTIFLREDGGWIDTRTRLEPNQLDFLGVLANLRSIKIRGAFFVGPETVKLSSVQVWSAPAAGSLDSAQAYPCCSDKITGKVEVCFGRLNEMTAGQKFNCLGSKQYRVAVKSIYPRFSRRSGGATITVRGENFGLHGSKSILRIAGKPATSCRYPSNEFVPGNAPTLAPLLPAHCSDGVLNFDEDKPDCGGGDCPKCLATPLPPHCTNGLLDSDETAVGFVANKIGVVYDCGGSCQFPKACCDGKKNNDETSIDCGGTYCQPCNPREIPVGTASAMELVVLNSGTCSQTGCQCYSILPNGSSGCVDFLPNLYVNMTVNVTMNITTMDTKANASNTTDSLTNSTDASNLTSSFTNTTRFVAVKFKPTNCTNLMYLSSSDKVPSGFAYQGKKIFLSGGPGQGQWAIIQSYEPGTKLAILQSNWQKSDDSNLISDPASIWTVGTVQIIRAGQGYVNGTWKLPRNRFAVPSLVQDEAWGTFTVDSSGAINEISIANVGQYGIITSLNGQMLSQLNETDIVCLCPKRNNSRYLNYTALLSVNWYTKQLQTPTNDSTYMITDTKPLQNWNLLHSLPKTPQHPTLICQTPPGEGSDLEISVDSHDETDAVTVNDCSTASSKGFEYGALDFIWSLQLSIRQAVGVKSLTVTSLDIDSNAGDIYLTGTIVGSCQETVIGCMGFISAQLPFRGLYTSGSFKPLTISPLGAIVSFIVRLDRNGNPLWLTQIDVSDFVGQVQATSLIVDSSSSPPQIRLTGLYFTTQNIRFWNINPATNMPYKILRSDAEQGAGRCNRASCDGDSCSTYIPAVDTSVCLGVFNSTQYVSCRNRGCAYYEGFPSALSNQPDVFIAEISTQGQFAWVKTRISTKTNGATISRPLLASGMKPTYAMYASNMIQGDTYLSFTLLAPARSPDLRVTLGEVASELLTPDAMNIQPFQLSIPVGLEDDRWSIIAQISSGGILWARQIGPLGINGSLNALKATKRGVFIAGQYTPGQSTFLFQSCNFSAFKAINTENDLSQRSYQTCFPEKDIFAHYTVASWEFSKKGRWDDISGNKRHSNVTRGAPFLSNESNLKHVQGDEADGILFPLGGVPPTFTLCSVSKMTSAGVGSVIDAVGNDKWVHGHFGGYSGFASYGNNRTLTRLSKTPTTDWLIMCGQNRNDGSIFSANGVLVGNLSGGLGNRTLTINYGYGFSLGIKTRWAVMEIILWSRYLTATELDSVVLYYKQSMQYHLQRNPRAKALPAAGIQNVFIGAFDSNGNLRWHKEAIGGNVSLNAIDVTHRDMVLKSSYREKAADVFEDPEGYVYIAGSVASSARTDFGVMKYPLQCSEGLSIGTQLTLYGDPLNRSNSACSGQILSRRNSTNIFVVKYSATSGEPQWLKRLGQKDSNTIVSGIAVDPVSQQVFVSGSYSFGQSNVGYQDVFDLIAAKRPRALGCPVDQLNASATDGMIIDQMNPDIGRPNCSFTPHTAVPDLKAGFLACIDGYNVEHGSFSRPWSQCLANEEAGCNADGLKWAKMLGSGVMETQSTTAESFSGGVALRRTDYLRPVIVFGRFKGFIQGTKTGGIKTPGVDDDGFFNCCRNLGIANLLDEIQDIFESYVMALGE